MEVYTENANMITELSNAENELLSGTLHLPEGEQILTIKLVDPGKSGKAMEWLKFLAVHRIPKKSDPIIQHAGINVSSSSNSSELTICKLMNESFNYLYKKESIYHHHPLSSKLRIEPFADNAELIKQVTYFIDFKTVAINDESPYNFEYTFDEPGSYTINVEFTDVNGIKNSSRVQVVVEG